MTMASWRLGVDIGGTFTDFVLEEVGTGRLHLGKTLTTPTDPSDAVIAGLAELLVTSGCPSSALTQIVHGTTLGTNAVIERTGAVIRTRRPAEVSPLPRRLQRVLERDRYRVYLAVDDGSSDTIVAWKTGERHAIPQGARATVVASPLLGHIRRTSPVGHVIVE